MLSIITLVLLVILDNYTDSLAFASRLFAVVAVVACIIAATVHKTKAYALVYVFGLLSFLMHMTVARLTETEIRSEDLESLIMNLAFIPFTFFMCIWIVGAYKRSKWLEALGGKGIFVSVILSICLFAIHWVLWINE